jgi:hypothetical protein
MRLKVLALALIAFAVFTPRTLYAVIGTDNIVTDPPSYTYYVQQIEQATEMLQRMQQEVETLGGLKTATDDVKRQVYRVQDAFRNAMNNYIQASESLANSVANTPERIDKLFSTDRDSITTSSSDGGIFYEDTAAFLDDVYLASGTMDAAKFLHINDDRLRRYVRKDLTRLAWKKLLYNQDEFNKRQDNRLKRVKEMMKHINESIDGDDTVTVIAMQVNIATLLGELVQTQTELLELQRSLATAQALEKYTEVSAAEIKKKLEILKDDDPARKEQRIKDRSVPTPAEDARLRKSVDLNSLYGF